MNRETPEIPDEVDHETVRSAARVLLAAASLALVAAVVSLLPGVDRLARLPVVSAIVALLLAALLVSAAPRLALLTRRSLSGPATLVENAASVVYWLLALAAVLVTHAGLAGLVTPLFGDAAWLYDGVFLLVALAPVAAVAARLYDSLDPGADLIAEAVVGTDERDPGENR